MATSALRTASRAGAHPSTKRLLTCRRRFCSTEAVTRVAVEGLQEEERELPPPVGLRPSSLEEAPQLSERRRALLSLAPRHLAPGLLRQARIDAFMEQRAMNTRVTAALAREDFETDADARRVLCATLAACLEFPNHARALWERLGEFAGQQDPAAWLLFLRSRAAKPRDALDCLERLCPGGRDDFKNLPPALTGICLEALLQAEGQPYDRFRALIQAAPPSVFLETPPNRAVTRGASLVGQALEICAASPTLSEEKDPLPPLLRQIYDCRVVLSTSCYISLLRHYNERRNNDRILLMLYDMAYQERERKAQLNPSALANTCEWMLDPASRDQTADQATLGIQHPHPATADTLSRDPNAASVDLEHPSDWMRLLTATRTYLRAFKSRVPNWRSATTVTLTALKDADIETASKVVETLLVNKQQVTPEQIMAVLTACLKESSLTACEKVEVVEPLVRMCAGADPTLFPVDSVQHLLDALLVSDDLMASDQGTQLFADVTTLLGRLGARGRLEPEAVDQLLLRINAAPRWDPIVARLGTRLHFCRFGFSLGRPWSKPKVVARERAALARLQATEGYSDASPLIDELANHCAAGSPLMRAVVAECRRVGYLEHNVRHAYIRWHTTQGWKWAFPRMVEFHLETKHLVQEDPSPEKGVWGETLSLNAVLFGLLQVKNWAEVVRTLRTCSLCKVTPFETILRNILYSAAEHGEVATVHEILGHLNLRDQNATHTVPLRIEDFERVFTGLLKAESSSGVFETLENLTSLQDDLGPVPVSLYNRLLAESPNLEFAMSVLAFLLESKTPPTVDTYKPILNLLSSERVPALPEPVAKSLFLPLVPTLAELEDGGVSELQRLEKAVAGLPSQGHGSALRDTFYNLVSDLNDQHPGAGFTEKIPRPSPDALLPEPPSPGGGEEDASADPGSAAGPATQSNVHSSRLSVQPAG